MVQTQQGPADVVAEPSPDLCWGWRDGRQAPTEKGEGLALVVRGAEPEHRMGNKRATSFLGAGGGWSVPDSKHGVGGGSAGSWHFPSW